MSAKPLRSLTATCLLVAGISSAVPVSAQDGVFDMGTLTNTLSVDHVTQAEAARAIDNEVSRPSDGAALIQTEVLNFRSTPARTKTNLAHFTAQARAVNRSAASELERLFATVDVIGAVSDRMRGVGLDPANTADAYAVWWIIAWSAAHGKESPEDDATFQAVSRQARAAFGNTDGFARLPDADKQQFAEAMMVQAVLLDSANDQARGGTAALRQQLAAQAKRGASEMGLDLATMTLTSKGFRPRKGAALDDTALSGAAEEARLAAATEGEEDGDLATYAAVAAAAGAGLCAAWWLGRGGRNG